MKLEPVVVREICASNNLELDDLLDDDLVVDNYDDEITITFSRKSGFVMPVKYNSDGLIKREDDIISGNLAYVETVIVGSFSYKIYIWIF